jgi:hypothetical protein
MKFKDIETTPEEVTQFLKEVGFDGLDLDEIEVSDRPTLKDQVEAIEKRLVMLDDLYEIAIELDSRETSNNCVVDRLQSFGWDELCDKGIEILEKLKKI